MISHFSNSKLFFLLVFLSSISLAQERKINIVSNIDSARVYINSQFKGFTPLNEIISDQDTALLCVTDEEITLWSAQKIATTVVINKDTTFSFIFRNRLNIVSSPAEAKVFIDDRFIGNSPLFVTYEKGKSSVLKISKENFESRVVQLDSVLTKSINVYLQPLYENRSETSSRDSHEISGSNLITYLIIGGVAAGLVSGYTKMKADNLEKEYKAKKSDKLKSDIYTLDTISNLSLILFEGCLISVNYLLLKD